MNNIALLEDQIIPTVDSNFTIYYFVLSFFEMAYNLRTLGRVSTVQVTVAFRIKTIRPEPAWTCTDVSFRAPAYTLARYVQVQAISL